MTLFREIGIMQGEIWYRGVMVVGADAKKILASGIESDILLSAGETRALAARIGAESDFLAFTVDRAKPVHNLHRLPEDAAVVCDPS